MVFSLARFSLNGRIGGVPNDRQGIGKQLQAVINANQAHRATAGPCLKQEGVAKTFSPGFRRRLGNTSICVATGEPYGHGRLPPMSHSAHAVVHRAASAKRLDAAL